MRFEDLVTGIENAEYGGKKPYLAAPGLYTLEVERCMHKETRERGDAFIVEFKVIDSTNPTNPAGSSAAWFRDFKYKESAQAAIKEFLGAILKKPKAEVDPVARALLIEAVGESNPLEGATLKCETFMVKTRAGKDFTMHKWSAA